MASHYFSLQCTSRHKCSCIMSQVSIKTKYNIKFSIGVIYIDTLFHHHSSEIWVLDSYPLFSNHPEFQIGKCQHQLYVNNKSSCTMCNFFIWNCYKYCYACCTEDIFSNNSEAFVYRITRKYWRNVSLLLVELVNLEKVPNGIIPLSKEIVLAHVREPIFICYIPITSVIRLSKFVQCV